MNLLVLILIKRVPMVLALTVAGVLSGCNLFDTHNRDQDADEILHSPAFERLTDSITKFPEDYTLHIKRGELLSQKNFHEVALADYKKAWEIHPDDNTALSYSASLFLSGNEEDAISFLQQCIKRFPQNPEFPRRLSEAFMQIGNSKEALTQYNNILAADSSNFEAWYDKGVLLARLNDTAGAIRALEKAYSLQPLQIFGVSLANLYAETRNPKAIELCDELINKDTLQEQADALYLKGVYYSNIDQKGEALEEFEKCIRRDWKFTEAYIEKGIILYHQKNYDNALQTFTLAAKVSNTYADVYYWTGRCYEAIGNNEQAADNYNRALALDGNFSEAREALKNIKKR